MFGSNDEDDGSSNMMSENTKDETMSNEVEDQAQYTTEKQSVLKVGKIALPRKCNPK